VRLSRTISASSFVSALRVFLLAVAAGSFALAGAAQEPAAAPAPVPGPAKESGPAAGFSALKLRQIGPFRGGRVDAVEGVPGEPLVYYFGGTGGGVFKTTDGGHVWSPITDGQINFGSPR
jgi:hypothetical protein